MVKANQINPKNRRTIWDGRKEISNISLSQSLHVHASISYLVSASLEIETSMLKMAVEVYKNYTQIDGTEFLCQPEVNKSRKKKNLTRLSLIEVIKKKFQPFYSNIRNM